jgi:hypothetical protein
MSSQALSALDHSTPKKEWESPAIVLEHALVARAQGPILGDDDFQQVEEDPFLGAFTASDTP